MANYTIVGGDNKEYGPVTGEEIRQWIVEGRLDGSSRARGENDTEWRSLSAFPEFATMFQPRTQSQSLPPIGASHGSLRGADLQEVKNPAISLIVIGGLSLLLALWNIFSQLIHPQSFDQVMATVSNSPPFNDPQFQQNLKEPAVQNLLHLMFSNSLRLGEGVFSLVMSVLVVVGGLRMLSARNYEFAVVAAILVMIPCLTPCPCCVVGLPCGIWALMVLRKPDVKDQFH